MAHTIDELLVLSRTGERDGPGEEVDLAEAVADARRRWARTAAARGIALSVERDGGRHGLGVARRPRPRGRRGGRERHRTTRPRGGRVTVRATGDAIEVLDEGPGLAPGEEDEVFAASTAAGRARRARPAPGWGCRSRAS